MLAVKGARTVENTLLPFDRAERNLTLDGNQTGILLDARQEMAATLGFKTWADLATSDQIDAFTHLVGYTSNYHTYVLDKVIAVDFFSAFDQRNPLDGPAALRYRKSVLEPGSTKPAAELVKDFLGRPQSVDALKTWMDKEFEPAPGK